MNICTACNSRSNILVKLPLFAPDKKLAFVESVCEELVKDRFGPWYVFDSPTRSALELLHVDVASSSFDRIAPRGDRSESVPPAVAGAALGRGVGGSSYGIYDVAISIRGLAPSRAPVTIVPGSDRRATLAQPRGSPSLAVAF